ncbi:MAG TPA: MerR family transcriptional regulator [Jiangellales bacterium]|nr:MerR family transcriptional regulator [Jiangellales bacterium]
MAAPSGEESVAPPDAPLTVAAVARRLGVAPTTLRTWARRYGLGPSTHEAGTHRRYGAADLARLQTMRRLILEGVPAAEAARLALAGGQPGAGGEPGIGGRAVAFRPPGPRPATTPTRGGPAPVVELGRPGDRVRAVLRAAEALDGPTITSTVRASLDRRGAVPTWEGLVAPVLVELGARWERTGRGVDVEHLASEAVLGALRSYQHRLGQPATASPPVLLACTEEEQHSLPLHALAASLAERRVATRVLGARVPQDALAAAIRRTGPSAVFLWSTMPSTGDPRALSALPAVRPAPLVVLGGPGWAAEGLPLGLAGLAVVDELAAAVEALAVVGA